MYPPGHARNTSADLDAILAHKNVMLGDIVFSEASTRNGFVEKLQKMRTLSAPEMASIYDFDYASMRAHPCIDG